MKKILLLAGEESGLIYANRLKALLKDCEVRGYQDCGFATHDLAVMGFGAVLWRLFYFLGVERRMKREIDEWRPDAVCTIDYPGMNLRLAAYAKKKGIRTVHVVCPQIWAWKASRKKKIEKSVDRLCCFLPFEPALFRPGFAVFTGHPLADGFPARAPTRKRLVALLPGSRLEEIERILPTMIEAVSRLPGIRAVIPAANDGAFEAIRRLAPEGTEVRLGGAREVLLEADCAVVASGTATLEAALARCPTVLVYRVGPILAWFARRVIKGVRHIGLLNVVWEKSGAKGPEPMPELLQDDFTAGNVSHIISSWLESPAERERAVGALDGAARLLSGGGAMERIVREIMPAA